VPAELTLVKLAGAGEDMNLLTFTFQEGAAGPELYLTVENEGENSACDANITLEFFDESEASLAAWVGPLYIAQLYQRSDDPGSVLSCLEPGEVAMAGTQELPDGIVIGDIGAVVYRFSYFAGNILPFELVPLDALVVTGVQSFETVSGRGFRGVLENGLDVPVGDPRVSIFPVNRVGRPLGMATSSETVEIPAGGRWEFETTLVRDLGVDHAVFAGASPVTE
jgi:hypothetical protein